jgi:mannose-6-phosphate isomerase-like protein (cupin superfamily)
MIDINTIKIIGPLSSIINQGKFVEKIWGTEVILPGDGYTTKIMIVKPGYVCSVHFHRIKKESFLLISGVLDIKYWTQDGIEYSDKLINQFDSLILPNCTPHTFSVPKDQKEPTIFIESSTEDNPNDSYRFTQSKIQD